MIMRARIPVMSLAVLFAALALACQDEGSALVAPEGIQAAAGGNPGPGVVKSVNGLTGDVNIAAGDNITVTESNNTITIAAPGSSPWSGVEMVTAVSTCSIPQIDNLCTIGARARCPVGKIVINGGFKFGDVDLTPSGVVLVNATML